MAVVARLKVQSVKVYEWGSEIEMFHSTPPAEDDPHYAEIKAFHAATPAAKFTASIKNALAAEQFQPGQEFYVNFVPVAD
jgi:hypothetical protein